MIQRRRAMLNIERRKEVCIIFMSLLHKSKWAQRAATIWVMSNKSPEEVFTEDVLLLWAKDNGHLVRE